MLFSDKNRPCQELKSGSGFTKKLVPFILKFIEESNVVGENRTGFEGDYGRAWRLGGHALSIAVV